MQSSTHDGLAGISNNGFGFDRSTVYRAAKRGSQTFSTVDGWPFPVSRVAEVAVEHSVSADGIAKYAVRVEEMRADSDPRVIWEMLVIKSRSTFNADCHRRVRMWEIVLYPTRF